MFFRGRWRPYRVRDAAAGVTIWGFQRLVLQPGDPLFGQWHESTELLPLPLHYDRVVVVARVHRARI